MTPSPFDVKISEAQVIVDRLGLLASTSERAVALAEAGFPVCFAHRAHGNGFTLADSSTGGVLATGARAFTTTVAQLRGRREEATLTVAIEIYDGSRRLGRAVYEGRSGRIVPWREVVCLTPDGARASSPAGPAVKTPSTPVESKWTLPDKAAAGPAVIKANTAVADAQSALDATGANLLRLREVVKSADRQAEDLETALGARLAVEMLDGKEPEDAPPEVKKIERLRRKRDAARISTQLAQEAWSAAKQSLTAAKNERERAVLDWAAVEQTELINKVRAALSALAPDLARMIAVDHVKNALAATGSSTVHRGHPGLTSTKVLAERLARNLPRKLSAEVFSDREFKNLVSTTTATCRAELENPS